MGVILDVLSSLLVPLTISSYLPQWRQVLASRIATGISQPAVLLLALSAQAQIATMYFLFACPSSKRYGLIISKPPSPRDYINLLQLLGQWVCSLLFLALILRMQSESSNRPGSDTASASHSRSRDISISARTAIALLTGHAGICIFLALLVGVPRDDWLDLPFVTIMSINNICINPLITAATTTAFVLQIKQIRATHGPTALDTTTLLLQAVIFFALAISWPFRFTMPERLTYSDGLWLIKEWYPHVGWASINNAIIAIGQYLVLCAGNTATRGRIELGQDDPASLG